MHSMVQNRDNIKTQKSVFRGKMGVKINSTDFRFIIDPNEMITLDAC